MNVDFAPSKLSWLASRALHHLPIVRPIMERKEETHALELASASMERKRCFKVLDRQWAKKTVSYDTAKVQEELADIDRARGFMLGNIVQSKHWSRVFEYPYAAQQIRDVPRSGRILDCGSGLVSFQFYLAELGFEIHALDLSLRDLEKIAAIVKKNRLANIRPTFGNVLNLPFDEEYFDGALCISVLEHVIQVSRSNSKVILAGAVNELLRVLKKNAPLILTFDVNFSKNQEDPSTDEYGLKIREYEELCDYFGIKAEPLPEDRLYSSDTLEGSMMGENLAVYSITIAKPA